MKATSERTALRMRRQIRELEAESKFFPPAPEVDSLDAETLMEVEGALEGLIA